MSLLIVLLFGLSYCMLSISFITIKSNLYSNHEISLIKLKLTNNFKKEFEEAAAYIKKKETKAMNKSQKAMNNQYSKPKIDKFRDARNTNQQIKPSNKQNSKPKQIPEEVSYAHKSIIGENLIHCRDFVIDSPKRFEFLGSYINSKSAPVYSVPEIIFLGRSNVGKSSLLNCMTGSNKKLAVESKTPGRTQMINLFKCQDNINDLCIFVDLPGYGFAKTSKGKQSSIKSLLVDYLANRISIRLAILLVDSRLDVQSSDLEMIQYLKSEQLPFVVIATKVDKLNDHERVTNIAKLSMGLDIPFDEIIPFSSITGEGKKAVWNIIRNGILGKISIKEYDDRIIIDSIDEHDELYSENNNEL